MSRMLRHVPYTGSPHVREIKAADFRSIGVDNQGAVTWWPRNKHTAEVSDEAADWLLATEIGEWEVIDPSIDGEASSSSESVEDDEEIMDASSASTSASKRSRRS